jgi:hypothetical protein
MQVSRDFLRTGTAIKLFIPAVLLFSLWGCSGSGGQPVDLLQGTVLNKDGTPAANAQVRFDNSSQITTETNAQGQYRLAVPTSQITGKDNLWVIDKGGTVLLVTSVTVSGSGTTTVQTTLPSNPPAPPPPIVNPAP